MRQRLAILFLLPCLWLARPTVLLTRAMRSSARSCAAARSWWQAPGATPAAVHLGRNSPAVLPRPRTRPTPGTTAPPHRRTARRGSPAGGAVIKLDKYNDSHSIFRQLSIRRFRGSSCAVSGSCFCLGFVGRLGQSRYANHRHGLRQVEPDHFLSVRGSFAAIRVSGSCRRRRIFGSRLALLLVMYLATYMPYVLIRNKSVELHKRVFTTDWFRYEFAHLAGKVGWKIEHERKADYEKGAPVDLMAIAAPEERENQANLITARQSPGYLLRERFDRRDGRSSQRKVHSRLHAAVGRGAAAYRRRVAQRRCARS